MVSYLLVVILLAIFIVYDLVPEIRKYKKDKNLVKFPLRILLLAIIAYIVLNDLFILMDIGAQMPYIPD